MSEVFKGFKVLYYEQNFGLQFSFQLSKVELINTYLSEFQVKIPMGRPLDLNVKQSGLLCRHCSIQKVAEYHIKIWN